ncbi:GNAT superfamily N-acetyltransferase [Actinoplanes octamycinicus]|uniref:GNAT superfamily N-acetyltransferase n=2 Tax=Actinoplanes octamycinicus TaxID=135948 RepID=A0A7W7H3K5_9ACTN|nr:GNAT family N-acetyltransferase [Actinoplanes octamycinicus]MBB4743351.1 GNAT superfamily N-acetyltransferase [Actinoplanes octamycinicus]
MQIRSLDGDDEATVDLLLPGFRATMAAAAPADPPAPAALLARLLQRRWGTERLVLAAFDGERPLGFAKLGTDVRTDPAVAHGSLWVFPAERRRGAGRALLAAARDELRGTGHETLLLDAPESAGAAAFGAALGGRRSGANLRHRLDLRAWTAPAVTGRRAGLRLVRWTDACPDDLVESYARAWDRLDVAVNGQARPGGGGVRGVRLREAEAARSGNRQAAVAAVRAGDGEVVGYSTLFVRNSPMADTGETLVLPERRRQGIGLLLKTELIGWTAAEHPHLSALQAWNDERNAAVVALNRRIGFTVDQRWLTYRFDV